MKRFLLICALLLACAALAACRGGKVLALTEGESAVLSVSIPKALRETTLAVDTGEGSAFGHRFGSGQDFTVNDIEPDAGGRFLLPVAKGATTLDLVIRILDDDVFETEETAVLRFSGDAADFASAPDLVRTFRILDNDTVTKVDVKKDFGARGDGKTDDTEALQNAIDAVAEAGGGVVFLPKGEYIVSSVTVNSGMTVMGEEGTLIKRPPMQGKWCRTFYMQYTGEADSAPMVVRDMTIDGNSQNQGKYKRYELEQAHLLFFCGVTEGGKHEAQSGRARGAAENLTLQNCVGDGVSVYSNADVGVYNIDATDVFRGGLVITGGNTTVRASTVATRSGEMDDPGGIDIEVDGEGFGGSFHIDVEIHRFRAESGDFDVVIPDGGVGVFCDCTVGYPIMDVGGDNVGELTFNRCRFALGVCHRPDLAPTSVQYFAPNLMTFNDCEFVATATFAPDPQVSIVDRLIVSPVNKVQWLGVWQKNAESRMVFNRCQFAVDESVLAHPGAFRPVAVFIENTRGDNCQIVLNDCVISKDYEIGVYIKTPAHVELNNLANYAAAGNLFHENATVVDTPRSRD